MSDAPLERREASRALLVTPDERLLLMQFDFPWREERVWLTPGGGLEPGEAPEVALLRELREETGLRLGEAGREIWHRRVELRLPGRRIEQFERFYWIESEPFEPRALALELGAEAAWFVAFRWWPIAELPERSTGFAPPRLGAHLRAMLGTGLPAEPIAIEG